jgi:DNA-binding MarR family transcriptional regulator
LRAPQDRSSAHLAGPEFDTFVALAAFRRALRQFLKFSETAAETAGVTPQQYQALLVIKADADGRVTISGIAEEMLLQHHGAVQLIDRLVTARLVRRIRSPHDRRNVFVALTPKGDQLVGSLAATNLTELMKHQPLLAESMKRLRRIRRGRG